MNRVVAPQRQATSALEIGRGDADAEGKLSTSSRLLKASREWHQSRSESSR